MAASPADTALRVYEGALRCLLLAHTSYLAFKAMAPPPQPKPRPLTPVEADAPLRVSVVDEEEEKPAIGITSAAGEDADALEEKARDSPSPTVTNEESASSEGSTIDDETATIYRDNETVSPQKRCADGDEGDDDELKTVKFREGNLASRYEVEVDDGNEDDIDASQATLAVIARSDVLRNFVTIVALVWISNLGGASESTKALWTTMVAFATVSRPENLSTVYNALLLPVFEHTEIVVGALIRHTAALIVRAATACYVWVVRQVADGLSGRELQKTGASVDACLSEVRRAVRVTETGELKASAATVVRVPQQHKPRSRAGRMRASVPF